MTTTHRRNLLVSLEGNIGSGKSTLLARISDAFADHGDGRFSILPEPVELWDAPLPALSGRSMLQAYYADGDNSFAFQMYVLKTRLDQVLGVLPGRAILSERCMNSHDTIFASGARSRGNIGDVQWVTYRGWVDSATRMSGEAGPNAVVYLRTSPGVCAQRRRLRSREAECDLPDALLEELHGVHDAYVRSLTERGVPVLLVDGDTDSSGMQDVVRVILGFLDGLYGEEAGGEKNTPMERREDGTGAPGQPVAPSRDRARTAAGAEQEAAP